MSGINDKLRNLPKTDEIIQREELASEIAGSSREIVLEAVRGAVDELRQSILAGEDAEIEMESILQAVKSRIRRLERRNLRRVINGTGIILHTNLGRARLNPRIAAAIAEAAENFSNLEYDLDRGQRGSRHQHISALAARITGAEDAMVVNNNAAAVALCLSALAQDREVVVSRGELVEIGGAFRVPEIMEQSGAFLKEVGTTNKTKLSDYENAIGENTGALLKVHTSNYRIIGFTEEAALSDMAELGHRRGLPVLYDMGSGLLLNLREYGVDEPTVQEGLAAGADVVMFSGDKLLGGPQAGIVVGKKEYIERMKKHPMARMVRSDKLTLAGLEETFRIYLDREKAMKEIPVLEMISADRKELKEKALRLLALIEGRMGGCRAELVEECSQIGGGSAPMLDLPTFALAFSPEVMTVDQLEKRLRDHEIPIIARISRDRLLLDVRTIGEKEFSVIAKAMLAIFPQI
ncbi:L-seryl-tRNA(Sec) selenium transferase [Bacilliculturomica massiliensis]|uniref:L-seryl-tRNA(Sec) selenium transferase n=1 Tax=Bacilliculturomica massiliensis TaxID=1917867 RepID=UPI001031A233|nr:L-seryl-tRNA(Sec) selenium transferase [Bacilliculturomica massiliensis]